MPLNYAARESRYKFRRDGAKAMRTWLRSLVKAVLGKVPGKTSWLDTATRMMIDADFSDRRDPSRWAQYQPPLSSAQASGRTGPANAGERTKSEREALKSLFHPLLLP
jgi:hypothetical protein